jgi:hypothetical protein
VRNTRSQSRPTVARVFVLLIAVAGLGLVVPLPAGASCAGPQLALEQGLESVVARRVGEAENERLLYDVTREQPLRIMGTNLTFDCRDTYSMNQGGCAAPNTEAAKPIVPLQDAEVVLTQRGRSWNLADVGEIGPDLTAVLDVTIPRSVRSGAATLSVIDPAQDSGAQLDLVVN